MPFSGGGVFTLTPGYTATTGQTILPSQHNPPLEDIAAGLNLAFLRDGRAAATGNFAMGGNRVTGMGAAVDPGDAVARSQVVWEKIGNTVDLAGISTVSFTDLSAYRALRIVAQGVSNTSSSVFVRVSSNNGATWLQGSSDYGNSYVLFSGSSSVISPETPSNLFPLSGSTGNNRFLFRIDVQEFNKTNISMISSDSQYYNSTAVFQKGFFSGYSGLATALNAIQIVTGASFVIGTAIIEGIRG
jgi:hypothetical protein